MLSESRPTVVLVSTDSMLIAEVQRTLQTLGLEMQLAHDGAEALAAVQQTERPGSPKPLQTDFRLLLLDAWTPKVADGRMLATLHEHAVRPQWAIVLVADEISDTWIARLREGVIDDILPRLANADAWVAHLTTLRRAHALASELESLRQTSVLEVQHDPVTGVLNRGTLLTHLFRETDRVQRMHGSLSLLAWDLDDFGSWNRRLGADAGDQLLREVARRAASILRTYDALGRLGRDEFVVMMPGCSAINATMLAERLRMDVFGPAFWVKDMHRASVEVRLSASFGVAISRGRSPVVLLRELEQVLGIARSMGPDAMRSTTDLPPQKSVDGSGGTATDENAALLFSDTEENGRRG